MPDEMKPSKKMHWLRWIFGGIATIVIGGVLAWYWLFSLADGDPDRRLDAMRIWPAIVFGLGGLYTLLLLARRQWFQEEQHKLAERAQHHREEDSDRGHELALRNSIEIQADARERRITDLYMKAADQLGSDKAAVRLAALYALDRLGSQYQELRQVIMDVWCAYLRMPVPKPGSRRPIPFGMEYKPSSDPIPTDEGQVRDTAQRLISAHLRDPSIKLAGETESLDAADKYWGPLDLDLSSAQLDNLELQGCRLGRAHFNRATFLNAVWFDQTIFERFASFRNANIECHASFRNTRFSDEAWFWRARFANVAFYKAEFQGEARFIDARFSSHAYFEGAIFTGSCQFVSTIFRDDERPVETNFKSAEFHREAGFNDVIFGGRSYFENAVFHRPATYQYSKFLDWLSFHGVTLIGDAGFQFGGASAAPNNDHIPPPGWRLVAEDEPSVCVFQQIESP